MPDDSKLQREDHDTLIRLETKMDQLVSDVSELKSGTATRLAAIELRINSLEKERDEINPPAVLKRIGDMDKQIMKNAQTIHDFQLLTWGLVILCTAIGFILSNLVNILNIFKK